jgi:hypothetical protein
MHFFFLMPEDDFYSFAVQQQTRKLTFGSGICCQNLSFKIFFLAILGEEQLGLKAVVSKSSEKP